MAESHKSLRLGDLLVEKGLITRQQLRQAIEIQQALQSQTFGKKNINARTELGEILIELGYISRHQLKSNLNWQRRLKATTAVMVFIAPLLTAACGGGGGGGSSPTASNTVTTSQVAPDTSTKPSAAGDASSVPSSSQSQSSVQTQSGVEAQSNGSSSPKSVSSSSAASSSAPSLVNGSVQLYWSVPTQRENGDLLDITEIGGYELRYKRKTEDEFKTIKISDGFTDAYYFDHLDGEYEFQIATFDVEGLYSSFVPIDPY